MSGTIIHFNFSQYEDLAVIKLLSAKQIGRGVFLPLNSAGARNSC